MNFDISLVLGMPMMMYYIMLHRYVIHVMKVFFPGEHASLILRSVTKEFFTPFAMSQVEETMYKNVFVFQA